MTKEELINNLNVDLIAEYSALVQYLQHSYLVKGEDREAVISELLEHADDEYGHAKILGGEIVRLGGVPAVDLNESPIVTETKEMLEEDLAWEEEASERYTKRVEEAGELAEYGLQDKLAGILAKEQEHANDLKMMLEK